ncbi:MAG: hypothetical protein U9N73_06775 [Candidatus Auribacterota bacterium]|nr:hypothetical protein [Candidatus Auribacterota bacterium]
MKQVSQEVIDNVISRMNNLEDEDVPRLIKNLGEEQPLILAYLMAYGEEMGEDDQGLLIFLGLNVWQMMSEGGYSPAKVSEEALEELEDKNIKMIESQVEASESEISNFAEDLMNGYNQRNIMEYILRTIMGGEGSLKEGDHIGVVMLCLMTVIDCLDRDHLTWVD